MTVEHKNIADAQRHEPKGASTATPGQVYVADGAGSGSWTDIGNKYGGIYSIDTDAATSTNIGTTPILFEGFSHNGESEGVTPDYTNDNITIDYAGVYSVLFTVSFSTNSAADAGLYEFRIRKNGGETIIGAFRQMSGTADTDSVTAFGLLDLAVNDVLTVYVESDNGSNTDDIDIKEVHFKVFRLI